MIVLAADVGGTHFNMAIMKDQETLLESHILTKEITSVEQHVNDFLATARSKGYEITQACFAVAGPVRDGNAELTNASLTFNQARLEKKTGLKVLLINDFEAIGYALSTLKNEEKKVLRKGKVAGPQVLVGAGTGLGKSFIIDGRPIASEAAHSPIPVDSEDELRLVTFLKHQGLVPVYQDVLSGRGLENLYLFFSHEEKQAEKIMQCTDAHCRDAVRLFAKYYARFAKTAALDIVAGEVFIAGGIAAKNPQLFTKEFFNEFNKGTKQFKDYLSSIPITLITNYDVSLRGAAKALEVNA